jgi:type IV pilus assembly protein PilC
MSNHIVPRPTLAYFNWQAINQANASQKGRLIAATEQEVLLELKAQGLQVVAITRGSSSLRHQLFQHVSQKEITQFSRQVSLMLSTGLTLIQALKLMEKNQPKLIFKTMIWDIVKQVESGSPLSVALHCYPTKFDTFYIELIQTGEQTGQLSQAFERIAHYREKSEILRAKLIKASIYPAMVISVSLLLAVIMLTTVIPEFETMFKGFNAQLPWFTRQVLVLSHGLKQYGLLLAIALFIFIITLRISYQRSLSLRLATAKLKLKLPLIGSINQKASIAKFSRTLSTSFKAGITLMDGLKTAGNTAGNLYYRQLLSDVHQRTASGMPVYLAMRSCNTFPEMVLQMIMVGEESGQLDQMFDQIAIIYENEVDNLVDNLGTIIEPLIILLLGGIVGGLVIAMYLPIFNLMSVLG